MECINNFLVEDIQISGDFKRTPPAAYKLDRVRAYYAECGELPERIVINDEDVLIDGYCTYLVARELGVSVVPVKEAVWKLLKLCIGMQAKRYFIGKFHGNCTEPFDQKITLLLEQSEDRRLYTLERLFGSSIRSRCAD